VDISVAQAKNRLTHWIRAVEAGESLIITRNGKPVAQLAPIPRHRRRVQLGGMKNRIRFHTGWDEVVDLERFLGGDL